MSTNGNRGKFSDRLKKMRRDRERIRKKGRDYDEQEEIKKNKIKATLIKTVILPPTVIAGALKNDEQDEREKKSDVKNSAFSEQLIDDNQNINFNNVTRIKTGSSKELVNNKEKRATFERTETENKKAVTVHKPEFTNNDISLDEKELRIHKLEKDILDLLKKRFIKTINELEVLQSDLYVLSQIDSNDIEYEKCKENIVEIRKILNKIRDLKEKYDYLKDNYDFEYLLGIDDSALVDKIIELRELCSSDYLVDMVEDYKLLDEYKFLYSEVDYLEEQVVEYKDYKERKVNELKERDINFDEFKDDIVNLDRINQSYVEFVNDQNRFLSDLDDKVSKIESFEEIEYRLKGFNQLLSNSFKYMGLLLLSPLKGLFPCVATETLFTQNTLKNLRNNLEWEESRRIKYEAIDYENSIRHAIYNVNDMEKLVDSTLEDIVRLKKDFNDKFGEYKHRFPEYEDTIRKLNKMENAIVGNKVKLNIAMERLKEKEKINANKMKKVKKLNDSQKAA